MCLFSDTMRVCILTVEQAFTGSMPKLVIFNVVEDLVSGSRVVTTDMHTRALLDV